MSDFTLIGENNVYKQNFIELIIVSQTLTQQKNYKFRHSVVNVSTLECQTNAGVK